MRCAIHSVVEIAGGRERRRWLLCFEDKPLLDNTDSHYVRGFPRTSIFQSLPDEPIIPRVNSRKRGSLTLNLHINNLRLITLGEQVLRQEQIGRQRHGGTPYCMNRHYRRWEVSVHQRCAEICDVACRLEYKGMGNPPII